MIVDLLKQLFLAIGQFAEYHIRRIFRLPYKPAIASTSPLVKLPAKGSTATEASIAKLSDSVGLNPAYKKLVQWPCYQADLPPLEVVSNPLFKDWAAFPGGHKWTHYFPVYEAVFGQIRVDPLRILEIGVLHGSSLKLWRQYFKHPKTIIVGIDVLEDCIKFDSPATGIHIRIGSQADPVFLKQLVEEFGPFDLIIDDGSHHSSHIISSFNHLYADGLNDTGIYFVEDLHAGYWHPWRDSKKSFLDVCKDLLEDMHAHYRSSTPSDFFINQPSVRATSALEVPEITTMIREIRFFDSIVAIYKARLDYVPYYLSTPE